MTSYRTFHNHEAYRRESTVLAEQFCGRLAQLLTRCLDKASSDEKLRDLFDETASLGRDLLIMVLARSGAQAESLDQIERLYNEAASSCRMLIIAILGTRSQD
jgi:hypothetical protein